ncbi:carbohydrate ABC transporter permease [Paenibacillus cymbidii]|uniref:carbohydrate ABC transporter permease n=1 Tax=Paenibacillus cymbidii TaxID=1639034 RepID=UPI0010819A93|nr:carbohydrate ABC transporter permease [Paenibacillus cymbidii]
MVSGAKDRVFDAFVAAALIVVILIVLFPLFFVVSSSLTPYSEVLKNGGFILIPHALSFEAYATLLNQAQIPRAFVVTVIVTVVGTLVNLLLTVFTAYPLSRRQTPLRQTFLFVVVFTLLFSGGLIPTYLIVKSTGLLNSIWAMIIPTAISPFNVLLMKSFFQEIPDDLFEQARIDGASETRIMRSIVLPVSLPSVMTIGLFYAVGHWNEFFQAIFYISKRELYPLQVLIRQILTAGESLDNVDIKVPTMSLQMASIVLASIPVIAVYPFVQKHFVKGVMLGAVKS